MSKNKKIPPKNKIGLELMHQRLVHRSTISLLAGDTDNVWGGIELKLDPDPFCTSCQISSMNKQARYKNSLKPKSPFKWVFMAVIPSTATMFFTSDTNFLIIF